MHYISQVQLCLTTDISIRVERSLDTRAQCRGVHDELIRNFLLGLRQKQLRVKTRTKYCLELCFKGSAWGLKADENWPQNNRSVGLWYNLLVRIDCRPSRSRKFLIFTSNKSRGTTRFETAREAPRFMEKSYTHSLRVVTRRLSPCSNFQTTNFSSFPLWSELLTARNSLCAFSLSRVRTAINRLPPGFLITSIS